MFCRTNLTFYLFSFHLLILYSFSHPKSQSDDSDQGQIGQDGARSAHYNSFRPLNEGRRSIVGGGIESGVVCRNCSGSGSPLVIIPCSDITVSIHQVVVPRERVAALKDVAAFETQS